jgi:HD-GYP domain-containing protein (c-di-GMP phosphodiesterase class II)
MKNIQVAELKPGMKFSAPVYVDGVNLLVPENIPIKESDIKRLNKWKVEFVSTEGSVLSEGATGSSPVSKEKKESSTAVNGQSFFQQAFNRPEQQKAIKTYSALASMVKLIFAAVSREEVVDGTEVNRVVDTLLSLLEKHNTTVVEYILYGFQGHAGPVENALNCSLLSVLVGKNLSFVKHKLIHLATAALLHDVGMLRIPEDIVNKNGKLTTEELRVIRTHPILSYKIITKELGFPEEVGLAALQHQERWDGAGYPRKLSGSNIIVPARIISVIDSFEAMVSKRPYRSPMIGYTAMRHILSDNSRRFDPEILKVFIRTIGIYPIGSIVLLNNSCIGRVVENNTDAPLKPKVKIMINHKGQEYANDEDKILDLYSEKKLFIARAVDPKELAEKVSL